MAGASGSMWMSQEGEKSPVQTSPLCLPSTGWQETGSLVPLDPGAVSWASYVGTHPAVPRCPPSLRGSICPVEVVPLFLNCGDQVAGEGLMETQSRASPFSVAKAEATSAPTLHKRILPQVDSGSKARCIR